MIGSPSVQFRCISVTLNEPLYHLIDIYTTYATVHFKPTLTLNSYISNALGINDRVSHSSLCPEGTNKDAAAAILISIVAKVRHSSISFNTYFFHYSHYCAKPNILNIYLYF